MNVTHRPIKVWPDGWQDPHRERTSSRFDSTYAQTLDLLDRELWMLSASECIVQLAVRDRDVRVDGALRADVKVVHPGVILTFTTKQHGDLVYSTDRFTHWHANLRAIALGLEALRKVERYGIAERGQQYAGYRELGSGIALGPAPMTLTLASQYVCDGLDGAVSAMRVVAEWSEHGQAWWREVVKRHHPDKGGDAERFRLLDAARKLLDKEAA